MVQDAQPLSPNAKDPLEGHGTDEEKTHASDVPQSDKVVKTRLKPGERRIQILQALAMMLERPGAERVTTASLAAQIGVSEAAL